MTFIQNIKRHFSLTGITIISALISLFPGWFFLSGALNTIITPEVAADLELGILIVGPPLQIFLLVIWVLTFTILSRKIFQGSRLALLMLLVLVFLITPGLYLLGLSKHEALFKAPFLGAGQAPLAVSEKESYEQRLGFKLYAPTYLPSNFEPDHTYFYDHATCPKIEFLFRDQVTLRTFSIFEKKPACLSPGHSEIEKAEYEAIKVTGHTKELYYQLEDGHTEARFVGCERRRTHHIEKGGTLIVFVICDGLLSDEKEQVAKMVQSLE